MYIEDLIQFVTSTGHHIFNRFPATIFSINDYKILESIASRVYYNQDQLTEKQATLILKLLKKNKDGIRPYVPSIDALIDNPQWKTPFRIIPTNKKISIVDQHILIEFPYDQEIVESFRKRNQEVHSLHQGAWNHNIKKWSFNLTEVNIEWLGKFLLPKEFEADEQFKLFFNEIAEVIHQIENCLPMLVEKDNKFSIVNAHHKIEQPSTTNLAEVLFWARNFGISHWDDAIDKRINNELHPTTQVLLKSSKHPWINSAEVDINGFADLIKYSSPVLIIIPGGSELQSIITWSEFAINQGIEPSQMSVMFRLPNEQADFNSFIKEAGMNNPVSEDTRIVFVSTKITKPLVKSGINFKTVINLGYYNYLHFSMSAAVDNSQNLVYYSLKEPNYKYKWQRHEL